MERENNKIGLLIHPLVWCFVSLQDIWGPALTYDDEWMMIVVIFLN